MSLEGAELEGAQDYPNYTYAGSMGTMSNPSHELLLEVSHTYQTATLTGTPPIKMVMAVHDLSRGTAIRRIREARDQGLIHPDAHPKYSRKLVAVAGALGVSPDDLREAVLEYADGDLRVQPLA
jgi:hypothetical protein